MIKHYPSVLNILLRDLLFHVNNYAWPIDWECEIYEFYEFLKFLNFYEF